MVTNSNLSNSFYFILHKSNYKIIEKIEAVLIHKMNSGKDVEKHLRRHSFKYLWVIDQILYKNLKHNKRLTSSQVVEYNELYTITNKVSVNLKDGKKITLAKLILDILQEAELIKKNNQPNYLLGIASEYQVINIDNKLNSFPVELIGNFMNQTRFVKNVESARKGNLEIDSIVKRKMNEWMNKLDFSQVNRSTLSKKNLLYLELYQRYKFQTQVESGRIYNSFTNMPKIIRDQVMIKGEKLGQIDLANAQSIFLSQIVLDFLNKRNLPIENQTQEFFKWTELGKSFEYLNNKEVFSHGIRRNSFKKSFWSCVMDRNTNMPSYGEVYEKIAKNIPQILEVVQTIKSQDHRVMAQQLQKNESDLMISIFEEVMRYGYCSLLHDAIFYPNSLYKEMRDGFLGVVQSKKIKCTIKEVKNCLNEKFPWTDYHISFEPEEEHIKIIREFSALFKDYPSDLMNKAFPTIGIKSR